MDRAAHCPIDLEEWSIAFNPRIFHAGFANAIDTAKTTTGAARARSRGDRGLAGHDWRGLKKSAVNMRTWF